MDKICNVVNNKTQILVKGFQKVKPAIVKIQKLSIENISLLRQLGLKEVTLITIHGYLSEALRAKQIFVELISPYIDEVTVTFIAIPAPVAAGKITIYIISPVKLMFFGLKMAKSLLWDMRIMLARVRSNFDVTGGHHLTFLVGYRLIFVILYALFMVYSNWNFNLFGENDRRKKNLGPDLAGRGAYGAPGRWPRRSDFKSRKAFLSFLATWW